MTEQPSELQLRTSLKASVYAISTNSLPQNFGPPGAVDYRTHPGQREADNPLKIFQAMRTKDACGEIDIKKLKGTIYSFKNRQIISRWIRDVCEAFALKNTTVCLATQLTDAFIISNLKSLALTHCQLAAVSSVWISAKFEELDSNLPQLKSMVEVCDGAYTAGQIIDMEEAILQHFRWKIPHTTMSNYFYLYMHFLTHQSLMPTSPLRRSSKTAAPAGTMVLNVGSVTNPDAIIAVNKIPWVQVVIGLRDPMGPSVAKVLSSSSSTNVGIYLCYADAGDIIMGKRLDPTRTPGESGLVGGELLFVGTAGSAVVFTEREELVVVRPLNSVFIHFSTLLLREIVLHVEFLRFAPHVLALAVLTVARCVLCDGCEAAKVGVASIADTLSISRSQVAEACEVLVGKYQEALLSATPPPLPTPTVPSDIKDRLMVMLCPN